MFVKQQSSLGVKYPIKFLVNGMLNEKNWNVKGVLKLLLLYFPTSNISKNFSWVSK